MCWLSSIITYEQHITHSLSRQLCLPVRGIEYPRTHYISRRKPQNNYHHTNKCRVHRKPCPKEDEFCKLITQRIILDLISILPAIILRERLKLICALVQRTWTETQITVHRSTQHLRSPDNDFNEYIRQHQTIIQCIIWENYPNSKDEKIQCSTW